MLEFTGAVASDTGQHITQLLIAWLAWSAL